MGNGAAVMFASYGAGRVPRRGVLAAEVKERAAAIGRAVAALRISGKDNVLADKLSRFPIRVRGLGPRKERELRKKYRSQAQGRCGAVEVDMMASDDGHNALGPLFRPSAF